MSYVLADTGPLYAAVDPSDQYHGRAQEETQRLWKDRHTVLVAWPAVLEAYTLVLRNLGTLMAHRWISDLAKGTDQIHPTDDDYRMAIDTVRAYPDQAITLFDAVLAAVSQRLRIPVWTYDHHFDALRVSVWR